MSATAQSERVLAARPSLALDERFDIVVCRPIAKAIAARLAPTKVTANQVTVVAGFVGISSGALFASPWPLPALGALSLIVYTVLDCADGELARLKGGGGWRGRMVDGWADLLTVFACHLGMVLYLIGHNVPLFELTVPVLGVWAIGLAAGGSHSWNSGVVDGLKQALKESSIDRQAFQPVCDAKGPVDWILWWSFRFYVTRIDRVESGRPSDYGLFRRAQWVGPTHHSVAMALSALCVGIWPQAYYGYFLLSIIPMNLYLAAVLRHGRRAQSGALAA